jgi:hypothetical protein
VVLVVAPGGAVVVVVATVEDEVVVVVVEDPLDVLDDDCADSSSESLASAAVRFVCAKETLRSNAVVSSEARVSPAVTVSFSDTSTAETVPATWNAAVAWCTAEAVPETSRVLRTDAVVSAPSR